MDNYIWNIAHVQIPLQHEIVLKIHFLDFPSGSVVKKSTCHCRRDQFDSWSGKIPHAIEQLRLYSTTTETLET